MYSKEEALYLANENRERILTKFFARKAEKMLSLRTFINNAIRAAIDAGLYGVIINYFELTKPLKKTPKILSRKKLVEHITLYLKEAGYKVEVKDAQIEISWN